MNWNQVAHLFHLTNPDPMVCLSLVFMFRGPWWSAAQALLKQLVSAREVLWSFLCEVFVATCRNNYTWLLRPFNSSSSDVLRTWMFKEHPKGLFKSQPRSFKFSTASPTCSSNVSGSPAADRILPYASKIRPTRILIIRMPQFREHTLFGLKSRMLWGASRCFEVLFVLLDHCVFLSVPFSHQDLEANSCRSRVMSNFALSSAQTTVESLTGWWRL